MAIARLSRTVPTDRPGVEVSVSLFSVLLDLSGIKTNALQCLPLPVRPLLTLTACSALPALLCAPLEPNGMAPLAPQLVHALMAPTAMEELAFLFSNYVQ